MANQNEIKSESFIEFVANQFNRELSSITLETSFREDLNADSLDLVEFVFDSGQKFEVEVPDEVAENLNTVEDALRELNNLRQAA